MAGVFAGMERAASNEQEPEPATPKRGPLRRPKHFNASNENFWLSASNVLELNLSLIDNVDHHDLRAGFGNPVFA